VGPKGSELRVVYKLKAYLGCDMNKRGPGATSSNMKTDKIKYNALVNKRILVISQPPSKINFRINLQKEHQCSSFLFK
jgi:hypothetical protein